MPTILQQQWLNANATRSYPLTEAATKKDVTGAFSIPDDFILDVQMPIHSGLNVEPERFYVKRIAVFGTGYNVAIAYDDGTSDPPIVAAAVIAAATHEEYDTYALPGQNDYVDTIGHVTIGRTDGLDALPPGQYDFDRDGAQLEVHCIQPMIQGVSGLVLVNGTEKSDRLQGDVEIQAGTNIRLTAIQAVGQNDRVRIDAIDGAGLDEDCVCDDETQGPAIRTVNGVGPNAQGDLTLTAVDCLDVDPITNGLQLTNSCAKPCCGCEELEAVTTEMEIFGSQASTITNFANRLESRVETMAQVVLGSRLNDDGCFTCNVE